VRTPSGSRPVLGRATVSLVRTPEQASPGRPAGYALEIAPTPAALHDALAAHAPDPAAADIRAAPRFPVNAPVKVIATPVEGPGADGAPRATIEYATGEELRADFIENLSQGGAFVRTDHPGEMGAFLGLELRLPNGVALLAQAVVVFVNAEGMGVRFTLDDEGEAILSSAIAQISGRPRRALVVDDDAFQRRVLSDALAERGFEVIAATDGAEGLRTLSEELLALDLLLTDVMMPGLDGEAFIRTIRKAGGELDLAIVAVTGRMEDGLEARLTDAGADAVLDKALGAELIAQAADAVLERKRLVLEPS
jgi:CheY-like chemotaxis protein